MWQSRFLTTLIFLPMHVKTCFCFVFSLKKKNHNRKLKFILNCGSKEATFSGQYYWAEFLFLPDFPSSLICFVSPFSQVNRHSSQIGQGWTWTAGKVCLLLHQPEAARLCLRDLLQDGRPAGSAAAAYWNLALGRGLTSLWTWEAHLLHSWLIYSSLRQWHQYSLCHYGLC